MRQVSNVVRVKYSLTLKSLQGIPGLFTFFLNTPYDWGYKLKPKEDIGGVYNDKTIPYPRGKSIGGTR